MTRPIFATPDTPKRVRTADVRHMAKHWNRDRNAWYSAAYVDIDGAPLGRFVTVHVVALTTERKGGDVTYVERKVAYADDPNVPMSWRRHDSFELVGPPSKVKAAIVRECREMANAILSGEPVPM